MRVLAVILATAAATNPMSKVIDLLHSLEAKVTKAGEEENRAFEEMGDWCKEFSMEKHHEISNGEKDQANSEATIEKAASVILSSAARIEELSGEISTAEAELAAATGLRKEEKATYQKTDAEFASSIDTLNRAHSILKRSLSNPNASLLQANNAAATVVEAFTAIVNAESAFSATDKAQLTMLAQGVDQPAAKAYESKSGSILNLIRDLREKAEDERDDAQKAEMTAQHNFDMKAQALNNLISQANADLADAKKTKAAGEEEKASSEGDLAQTVKDLKEDRKALSDAQQECMQTAAEHEESLASRKAELEALQKAEAIIAEKTGAAASREYSFVQLSAQRRGLKVVAALQQLARQENDQVLAQVAVSAKAFSRSGADVFGKVKGLIESMISKLDKEANEDAEKNAFCVSETEKSEKSRDTKQATVDKLSAKIDSKTARSAQLKEEVATLQQELASLSKLQGHMDKARADESAAFKAYSADMTNGIEGVRMALQVLREYYAQDASFVQQPEVGTHAASSDAAGGIISMLEVAEADFTRGLAEATAAEDESAATYEKTSQENKIAKTTKEQDVKYKGAEAANLDKEIGELGSDRASVNEELDSVNKYLEQLRSKCVQKPETYEERKARRDREISGLKEALTILENESAPSFLQRRQ